MNRQYSILEMPKEKGLRTGFKKYELSLIEDVIKKNLIIHRSILPLSQ